MEKKGCNESNIIMDGNKERPIWTWLERFHGNGASMQKLEFKGTHDNIGSWTM